MIRKKITIQSATDNTIRFILFILLLLSVCGCNADVTAEKRAQIADASKDNDIVIAIVDTTGPFSFLQGALMAVKELNQRGGILNRKIRPLIYNDEGDSDKGLAIAREISANGNVVAVVGHPFSGVAIPVSITYNSAGLVFISPESTSPDLTQHGFPNTFRNLLSSRQSGQQIAAFSLNQKFKKMMIVYLRNEMSSKNTKIFFEKATELGIEIVAQKSYPKNGKAFNELIAEIKKFENGDDTGIDAVLLSGPLIPAANIIKQARAMGVTIPFVGGGGLSLDNIGLIQIAGPAADGTIVPSLFNPKLTSPVTRAFVRRFKSEYFIAPDAWEAQGYDAIQILMHAMEKSGSTVPTQVSTTLHFLPPWNGVSGSYQFDQNGDIIGKKLYFKKVVNGQFVYIQQKMEWDVNPFEILEDITLRIPLDGKIETLDPGLATDKNASEIIEQLFLGLTSFTPETYQPAPELAEEWQVSKNGLFYLFRLRKDAKWTNGERVTAHDVVWAIQRNIKLETEDVQLKEALFVLENSRAIHKGYIEDVSKIGVKALDDFTLWFKLEKPCAYFPMLTALPVYHPLPRSTIEKYAEKWTELSNIQTNGAYKLIFREESIQTILQKNPLYYEAEKVRIPQVHYYILPVSKVGLAMYKNNQLDITGGDYLPLPLDQLSNIAKHPVLVNEYSQQALLYTYTYIFNPKPPLDNILVRKAISAAINRDLLIRLVTRGGEISTTTLTPPPAFGSIAPQDNIGIKFNPVLAKKWLSEAGYPDGNGFPKIELLYPQSERHTKIAKAVQTFLNHYLNIRIKLDQREWGAYQDALAKPGDLHIFQFDARGAYPDASAWFNMLLNLHSYNKISYNPSASLVQFVVETAQAKKASNPQKRMRFYKNIEKITCEKECVIVPIYFGSGNYLVKTRVKEWYNMAFGGQHIRNWYLENNE
ncbi:ABC transporter substrate-binding protein [Desulfococcaceae bacterium HSG9]|nr:ABC transporter substrate-binding protein [Desulfococcaceae bacterium HSG9]